MSWTAALVALLISKGGLAKAAGTAAAASAIAYGSTLETSTCSSKAGDDSVYTCARVCGSMSTLKHGREALPMNSRCPSAIPHQMVHSPEKISMNVTIRVKVCPRRIAMPG